MPTFIKLTTMSDTPIWVNVESIVSIEPICENSLLTMKSGSVMIVKEAPTEILKKWR